MPTTYKVNVNVTNRVAGDRYFIELFKQTSNIATATATLDANSGINSHTFIDLVNDTYKVRIGHECADVTIWTDMFPVNTTSGNANTQCKKPTMSVVGGLSVVAITTNADPTQGVEAQVFRNPIVGDPPGSANSDGKVLVKAAYFAAPTVNPLMMTGLTAGAHFVKVRAACNVTAYSEGGSSMVIIYSDWTVYEPVTVT